MKTIIPLLLILFCISGFGQTSKRTVEALQNQAKTFKKSDKYQITYDKFKDITIVQTEKYLIPYFGVNVAFSFPGKEMSERPEAVALVYTAYGQRDWRYLKDSNLILLIDNERADLGQGVRDSGFASGMFGETMTKEKLVYKLSLDTLEKMSKAKSIEFQIAKDEGKFNSAMLEMCKNFYQLTLL
ncbi:MAG TPA: hypothetical protein VIL74_20810 [Pyrinomonadaceae bacterium]|jgi:hypothetical protein